jgi:hypothetical protein
MLMDTVPERGNGDGEQVVLRLAPETGHVA